MGTIMTRVLSRNLSMGGPAHSNLLPMRWVQVSICCMICEGRQQNNAYLGGCKQSLCKSCKRLLWLGGGEGGGGGDNQIMLVQYIFLTWLQVTVYMCTPAACGCN